MKFRENTLDKAIFEEVVTNNCYGLPEKLDPEDVIIDIGSHIGSFAYACLQRGAKKVYCFEANYDNFLILADNLKDEIASGKAEIFHKAVWNNDDQDLPIFYYENDEKNTGASGMFRLGTRVTHLVKTIKLDTILNQIEQSTVKLCKIDCEGSEYKIIEASWQLRKVQEFVGEYHNISSAGRVGDLLQRFKDNGFVVEFIDANYSVGSFRAKIT